MDGFSGSPPGGLGSSPVISEPRGSTPLESARPDPVIPSSPLWAMKYLRHARLGRSPDREFDQIRWASADEDRGAIVYVIDDGDDHCVVARLVGESADGCTYCLVARVKRLDFEDVRAGWAQPVDLSREARSSPCAESSRERSPTCSEWPSTGNTRTFPSTISHLRASSYSTGRSETLGRSTRGWSIGCVGSC